MTSEPPNNTRKRALKLATVVSCVILGGILLWQFLLWQFSRDLRSARFQPNNDVPLGAFGDVVLDRTVLESLGSNGNKALLDQIRENPKGFDEKAELVVTWKRASSIIGSLQEITPIKNVVSSTDLPQIAPEDRFDPWNRPFCVYSDGTSAVVMTSGNKDVQIPCSSLDGVAKELAATISTPKLVRYKAELYAVVQLIKK